jgi:hypothetical protein
MPMSVTAVLLALAAAADPAITVTGHAWAPFISPMGEPFRARSATDDTLARWFAQADLNGDRVLTVEEMQRDAARFFAILDTDGDREIGPDELVHYEWEVAPDIQVMAKTRRQPGEAAAAPRPFKEDRAELRRRSEQDSAALGIHGLQGAARYGLLNMPQPVAAADADFNRGISATEFQQAAWARFHLLDHARQGRLTLAELETMRTAALAGMKQKRPKNAPDPRVGTPLPNSD